MHRVTVSKVFKTIARKAGLPDALQHPIGVKVESFTAETTVGVSGEPNERELSVKLVLFIGLLLLSVCSNNPARRDSTDRLPRTPILSEQKMCADQAAKVFKEYEASDYTDHYDAATQTCYMEMITRSGTGQTITVSDAFEHREFGYMILMNDFTDGAHVPHPGFLSECEVKPLNQPQIGCNSKDEFDELVFKYFGTTADTGKMR